MNIIIVQFGERTAGDDLPCVQRQSGVHLHFWSGNEVYWKIRWEESPVDGKPMRTMVVYKDGVPL